MATPTSSAADLLRTLCYETRLQMLSLLRRREFCVCELVDLFPISQPAVSGHLRRLKDVGLVMDDRRGVWVYYRACETLPPLVQAILDEVALPPELELACATPQPSGCGEPVPALMGEPLPALPGTGHETTRRRLPR